MRQKALSAMLGLLLCAALACAQPKIVGDHEVERGGFAILNIDGAGKTVLWTITPDPIQEAEIVGTLVFTGVPGGRYTATAVVIDFDAKTAIKLRHVVTFAGKPEPIPPGPQPGPDPPKPDPTPPIAGKLFVVVVEETRDAAANRGLWFTDKELWAYFREKGHRLRVVDKDVKDADGKTPADVKRFIDDTGNGGTPRLYLVGEDGKTRRAGPMPETPAKLLSLIKQYGG